MSEHEIHLGVSALRGMNKKTLASQKKVVILHNHLNPVAVLIPYPLYMAVQELRKRLRRDTAPAQQKGE